MGRRWMYLILLALVWGCAGSASAGLIAQWKLDDGAGTTASDSGGKNYAGTLLGGPTWIVGNDGGALELDGRDDYVDFGNPAGWPAGRAPRSMAGWGRTDTIAGGYRWLAAYGSPNTGQAMFIGMNGSTLVVGGYGGDDVTVTGLWQVGEWFHLGLTYDGTTAKAYFNGREVGSLAKNWNLVLSRAHIGRQVNDAAEFWDGAVDDIRIYDHVLTAAEMKALVPAKVKARKPSPADGAVGIVSPVLTWTPGDTAVWHNVYLGTNAHLTAVDCKVVGQVATTYAYAGGWQSGFTYYWRVDEVAADGTLYTGDLWHFVARGKTAYSPTPADGAVIAGLNPILLWEPGLGALRHQVFFGTKLEAVAAGTGDVQKATVTTPLYLPGKLEAQTTYYWRVDESDGARTYRGPVWSFTVATMEGFETNDFSKYPWARSGDGAWTITSAESHSGTYSARAGLIGDDESSSLVLRQDGQEGVVTFWCKVSCERGSDRLEFSLDGIKKGEWTGERDWQAVSFPVNAGVRTFTWTYIKDVSSSWGEDTAWIDDVCLPL